MKTLDVVVFGYAEFAKEIVDQVNEAYRSVKVYALDEETVSEAVKEGFEAELFDLDDNWEAFEHYNMQETLFICALEDDAENVYLTIGLRDGLEDARLIALASTQEHASKLHLAGANKVIAPNILGGMRIASEIIRPDVVEFLDIMLRDKKQNTRIEQVALPPGSPLAGKKLSDTKIRKATDVLVIALRTDEEFIYNPGPDTIITEGAVLVVLGSVESVVKLRDSLQGQEGAPHLIDRAPAPVSADTNK